MCNTAGIFETAYGHMCLAPYEYVGTVMHQCRFAYKDGYFIIGLGKMGIKCQGNWVSVLNVRHEEVNVWWDFTEVLQIWHTQRFLGKSYFF